MTEAGEANLANIDEPPIRGLDGALAYYRQLDTMMPGFHLTNASVEGLADDVILVEGDLAGREISGDAEPMRLSFVYEFRDGKIWRGYAYRSQENARRHAEEAAGA